MKLDQKTPNYLGNVLLIPLFVDANTKIILYVLGMYFFNLVPYVIVLIVLIIFRNKSGCPKAEGIPYEKGQR